MTRATSHDARSIVFAVSPRELATILAALSLRGADLASTTGEPIQAVAGDVDAVATAQDAFDALDNESLDELIERLSDHAGDAQADHGPPESPTELLTAFAAAFGPAVDADEEIDGGDAVDWLADFLPRVRRTLAEQGEVRVAEKE